MTDNIIDKNTVVDFYFNETTRDFLEKEASQYDYLDFRFRRLGTTYSGTATDFRKWLHVKLYEDQIFSSPLTFQVVKDYWKQFIGFKNILADIDSAAPEPTSDKNSHLASTQMTAKDFLAHKGITNAVIAGKGVYYYLNDLAQLLEEYAALKAKPKTAKEQADSATNPNLRKVLDAIKEFRDSLTEEEKQQLLTEE